MHHGSGPVRQAHPDRKKLSDSEIHAEASSAASLLDKGGNKIKIETNNGDGLNHICP